MAKKDIQKVCGFKYLQYLCFWKRGQNPTPKKLFVNTESERAGCDSYRFLGLFVVCPYAIQKRQKGFNACTQQAKRNNVSNYLCTMANLVNTNSAVSVRDAQKSGQIIILAENEVKNLKAGNVYSVNNKELFIESSFNPKNRAGSKTTYNGTFDGKAFYSLDITNLQKLVLGKTAREAGFSQKTSGNNPINGYIPSSRVDARNKAREWTNNAIGKVAEAGKMFTLTESEQETLKKVAIRYYRTKLADLYERYENAAAEKAAKAEAKRLQTVDGQSERAERAETALAAALAKLKELGVTL